MGQLSRTYFVNLMIFQSWGLLYAILQVLITALQMNSVNAVLGGNGVLNAFVGSSQMILLGAVSVLFSIAIALIPFLASRLVRGDVGSTVFALAAVVNRTARTIFSPSSAHKPRPLALPRPCLTPAHPPLVGRVRLAVQGQVETEVRMAVHWPNRNLQYLQAQM